MTTETITKKPGRKARRGPPGVVCSSCHKIAGAEGEGRVDDLEVSASGDNDSVTVTVGGMLVLTSACCSQDFKQYDLSQDFEVTVDHTCPKVTECNEAAELWETHAEDCEHGCTLGEPANAEHGDATDPKPGVVGENCEEGAGLFAALENAQREIGESDGDWEVTEEGEPEPYQRFQRTASVRRKVNGVLTYVQQPIKNPRYAKSWRGFTLTTIVTHNLCGETEEVAFGEGDIEAQSGDFEAC